MKRGLLLSLLIMLPVTTMFFVRCDKKSTTTAVYPNDCAHLLAGAYLGSDYCNTSGQPTYPCTVTAIDSTNVTFSNLGGVTVTAVLNCSNNTINIPTQSFAGNFSISGNGTYTANRIIIYWSGLSLGIPFNCNTTFTK